MAAHVAETDNMEKSERMVAAILSELVHRGFQHGTLQFQELGLSDDYAPFFAQSLRWLEGEGLIRAAEIKVLLDGSAIALNPAITSYGMSVLGAELKVGDGEIQKLAATVEKVRSGEAQYARAGNFAGGLLAAFVKSIG
jgi:hypothetical protein